MSLDLRVANVKERVNVFHALEMIGVHLLRGHSTQQILCPFHEDTKPSARVYSDSGKVFCFTCHSMWDPIQLVMKARDCGFEEAVSLIEKRFGLDPNAVNLVAAIKHNLSKSKTPNLDYLFTYVEDRLIAVRFKLGLEKYTKALYALDLYRHYHEQKRISVEEYRSALYHILRASRDSI